MFRGYVGGDVGIKTQGKNCIMFIFLPMILAILFAVYIILRIVIALLCCIFCCNKKKDTSVEPKAVAPKASTKKNSKLD